jgi:hypothetical protein
MPIAITTTLFLAVGGMVGLTKIFTFAPTRQPCRRRGIGGAESPIYGTKSLSQSTHAAIDREPKTYQEPPKQASDAKQVNGVGGVALGGT